MKTRGHFGQWRSGSSEDATPSGRYIGYWPGTVYVNPAGTVSAPSITLAVAGISANAIGDTSSPAAGTQSWIAAGLRVRVRNVGTMPTGLSATTVYYLGRPSATTVSFHATLSDAVTGTNKVSMSGGTSNIVIYQCTVPDLSGNGRDLVMGTNNNDATFLATQPYVSAASSGSNDTAMGVLDLSDLGSLLAWPSRSVFMAARVLAGTLVASRSLFGCGASAAADGPRINVDSSDTSKVSLQWYHGGGTAITLGTSAAVALSTTVPHHIALGIDGPRKRLHMWIDGAPDETLYNCTVDAASVITWPSALRFGGATATNCQASSWREVHLLSFAGSLPGSIDQVAAMLATTRYHRLLEREV